MNPIRGEVGEKVGKATVVAVGRAKLPAVTAKGRKAEPSKLAEKFAAMWKIFGDGSEPVQEHRFHPTRKFRFDFAWPSRMVAVEIDGGTFAGGRHTRGKGFDSDCDKINEAIRLGWRVLRFTETHLRKSRQVETVETVTNALKGTEP